MRLYAFERGDRVDTKFGPGSVVYIRMAPPNFSDVEAVSVYLDARRARPDYVGTMFLPSEITRRES